MRFVVLNLLRPRMALAILLCSVSSGKAMNVVTNCADSGPTLPLPKRMTSACPTLGVPVFSVPSDGLIDPASGGFLIEASHSETNGGLAYSGICKTDGEGGFQFLKADGELHGCLSGSDGRGGTRGFLYEIGRDGSGFRRIADVNGTVVGMDSHRTITSAQGRVGWRIGAIGETTDPTDLVGEHRRQNFTVSIDFMADGALWGVDRAGGQHRKGALFRIGLPH